MPGRWESGSRMDPLGRRCPRPGHLVWARQTSSPADGLEPVDRQSLENRSRSENLRTLSRSSRPGESRGEQLVERTEERSAAGGRPACPRGAAVAQMHLCPVKTF